MQAEGLEGAIYTGSFKYEPNLSDFFAQKLRNYFYYKGQIPQTANTNVQQLAQ